MGSPRLPKACITTIPKKVWENVINGKKSWHWLTERYKQPDWCGYPEALHPLGCWGLLMHPCEFNPKRCSTCDLCKKPWRNDEKIKKIWEKVNKE